MELIYSYVVGGMVEYEPSIDHDAYDENEDQMFYA